MRHEIICAAMVLTLAPGNLAVAQEPARPRQAATRSLTEGQPLRTTLRFLGSESPHLLTQQRRPAGRRTARKCLLSAGIAAGVIGGLTGAAFASEAKDEDKWKVFRLGFVGIGLPVGVPLGLTICGS